MPGNGANPIRIQLNLSAGCGMEREAALFANGKNVQVFTLITPDFLPLAAAMTGFCGTRRLDRRRGRVDDPTMSVLTDAA